VVPRESVLRGAREVPLDARRPAVAWKAFPEGQSNLPEFAGSPTCGLARTSFVFGLSSLFLSLLTGIPAVLMGLLPLGRIRRSWPLLRGTRLAGWGIALGLIGTFLVGPLVIGFTWAVLTEFAYDVVLENALGLPQFEQGVEDPEVANRE